MHQRNPNKTSLLFLLFKTVCVVCCGGLTATVANAQDISSSPAVPSNRNNLLSSDSRLLLLLPGSAEMLPGTTKQVRLGYLFSQMEKRTRVRLTAKYENMDNANIFASFDRIKAADLMDGVTALWLTRWEKDSPNSYRLIGSIRELDDVYLPKKETRRVANKAGAAFMEAVGGLPKQGVINDLQAGKTVNVSELSPELQKLLATFIVAGDKAVGIPPQYEFPLQRLNQATMSVETQPDKEHGFNQWNISIHLKDFADIKTAADNYEQRREELLRNTSKTTYTPAKSNITPEQAREIPALRQRVRLNLPHATAGEVLQALHKQYGISIIADAPKTMKERVDVSLDTETIAEAFDTLTALYPGTQWEYRPSKFFIFRSPINPVAESTK